MTDASKGSETTAKDADAPSPEKRRRGRATKPGGRERTKPSTDSVRSKIASIVWLVAVVCALFLAVGALLIALKANEGNAAVSFVTQVADSIDLWFSRTNGIFDFAGKDPEVKNALVNWGLAAVVYLIIGKVLDRLIRP